MKDTGKTINGVKLYSDPNCPPNTLFLVAGNFKSEPPRRQGKLIGIGWHRPTSKDYRLYRFKYWLHNQFAEWPDADPYLFREIFK